MAKLKSSTNRCKETHQNQNKPPPRTDSWLVFRSIFGRKHLQSQQQQQQQREIKQVKQTQQSVQGQQQQKKKEERKKHHQQQQQPALEESSKKCKKMKCSGSLCSNTKVTHRPENTSPELRRKRSTMGLISNNDTSSRSMKAPLNEVNAAVASTNSSLLANSTSSISNATSFRGMPFRRLSGCYECRLVVDPVLGFARDPSLRGSICSCPQCGEIFMNSENLELHQAVRHAVSELSQEDTSKNIVEIIFQSSWLKKQDPVCKIDRILKVHNTQRTISKFEEYRDSIKAKATKLSSKKHPRCIADGNELLRFHSTTFACPLGLNGSSNLCNSVRHCNVCSIIKNGFKESTDGAGHGLGILTTATSGKAHDKALITEEGSADNDTRAMLVCRVIAGRVMKSLDGNKEDYDSVAGAVGVYSNLEELYVFNPKAILPCFVVIYSGF